ncbi:MAG: ABC transporter transmembrane domain-containing protein, partial [Oscillatoria sp. PMC 1076.18]|nr:ABC transporter transmembrane domain-containing protein [Oscillatoria sp. PMC 1076.18]
MKVIFFLLQNSKKNFVLALITGLLAGASSSGIIALIHLIISTELSHFRLFLISFIFAWIGFGFFSAVSTYFLSKLSQKTIFDLRLNLTKQILASPLKLIEAAESKIFLVLTEDINTLANSLERIPSVFAAVATVLGCFILMAFISPLLLSCLLIILILAFPLYIFPLKKMQKYLSSMRQEWNLIFKQFYSLHQGIKELLLNLDKQKSFAEQHLYPACERQYKQAIKAKTLNTIASRWGDLFLLAGLGFIIFTLPKSGYITFQELSEFLFIFLFTLS